MTTERADPLRREMTTMVLYVAIVLLATVVAIPADELDDGAHVVALLWGAAAGLALAHWFAFHVAAQLYTGGRIHREDVRSGAGQVGAAFAVTLLATLPMMLFREHVGAGSAVIILTAVIALVGYTASRRAGMARWKALVRGALTLGVGVVVVAAKIALGH